MAKVILDILKKPGEVSLAEGRVFVSELSKLFVAGSKPIENEEITLPFISGSKKANFKSSGGINRSFKANQPVNNIYYADLVAIICLFAEAIYDHADETVNKDPLNPFIHSIRENGLLNEVTNNNPTNDQAAEQNFQTKVFPIVLALFDALSTPAPEETDEKIDEEEVKEQAQDADKKKDEQKKKPAVLPASDDEQKTEGADTLPHDQQPQQPPPETPPVKGLTLSDLKKSEKEVAWIVSPAIHQLFLQHGISYETLLQHPELQSELYAHVRDVYFASRGARGADSVSNRIVVLQKALNSLPPDYIQKLHNFYASYLTQIPTEKRGEFGRNIQETLDQLDSKSAKIEWDDKKNFDRELASLTRIDNPVIGQNARTAIEALIAAHGVPLEINTLDENGQLQTNELKGQKNNAIWIIKNLPDGYLKLVFGIDPSIKLTPEQTQKLREIAIEYAVARAMEIAIKTDSDAIVKGVVETQDDDIINMQLDDDLEKSSKQFAKALPGHTQMRSFIAGSTNKDSDGLEVVSRALSDREKRRIARMYARWNTLDMDTRRTVYTYVGIDLEKEVVDLNIIPERALHFRLEELIINAQGIQEAEKQARLAQIKSDEKLREFISLQNQIIEEERIRQYYSEVFLQQLSELEYQEVLEAFQQIQYEQARQHAQTEEELANIQVVQSLNEISVQEMIQAHDVAYPNQATQYDQSLAQTLAEEGGQTSQVSQSQPTGTRGLLNRLSNRFLRKEGAKSESGASKMAQGLVKEEVKKQALKKVAGLASKFGGIKGKLAALAITLASDPEKLKKLLKAIAAAIGALLFLLFKTITGSIGGMIGGAVGFFLGGPVGAVTGAFIGHNLMNFAKHALGLDGGTSIAHQAGQYGTTTGAVSQSAQAATTSSGAATTTPAATSTQAAAAAESGAASLGQGTTVSFGSPITLTTLTSLPIALITPLLAFFAYTAVTLYVIFTIVAAFLAPLPISYDYEDIVKEIDGFVPCWPTSGITTQLAEPGHEGMEKSKVNGIVQAIDIWCAPGAICQGSPTSPPEIFASHYGSAVVLNSGEDGYGLHVKVVSPAGWETVYGHLSEVFVTSGQTIYRGTKLGLMGNTGNTSGKNAQHLHYEFTGGLISSIVPAGEYKKLISVMESCSDTDLNPEAMIAVGPLTPSNVVATTQAEILDPSNPTTCSWQQQKRLAAAVNANFFNDATTPVGYAGDGAGTVQYYGDPLDSNGQIREDLIPQLSTLYEEADGAYGIYFGKQSTGSNWNFAVTGIFSLGPSSSNTLDERTIIGKGVANNKCTTKYAGQEVLFIAAAPAISYDEIEARLRACGATSVIHMDGGGSTAFCSNTLTYSPGNRNVPVNIGMMEAEVMALP